MVNKGSFKNNNKENFHNISHREVDRILDEQTKLKKVREKEQREAEAKIFFEDYPELRQYEDFLKRSNLAHKECVSGEGAYNYLIKSGDVAIKMLKDKIYAGGSSFVKLTHEAAMNNAFWEKRKELLKKGELPEFFKVPDIYRVPTINHPFYEAQYITGQSIYSKCLLKEMGNPAGTQHLKDKEIEELYIRSKVINWMQSLLTEYSKAKEIEEDIHIFIENIHHISVKDLESLYRELRTKQMRSAEPQILEIKPVIKNLDTIGILSEEQKIIIEQANNIFKKNGVSHRDWHAKNIMIDNNTSDIYAIDYGASAYINCKDQQGNIIYEDASRIYDINQLSIKNINDLFHTRMGRMGSYEGGLLSVLYGVLGDKKLRKGELKEKLQDPSWAPLLKYRGKYGDRSSVLETLMMSYSHILCVLDEKIKKERKEKET